jgi:hypothetical protein
VKKSNALIKANHEKWMTQWQELQEEL